MSEPVLLPLRRGALIDHKAPLRVARVFARMHCAHDGAPGILHWNGDFYRWDQWWARWPQDAIRASMYAWLEGCCDLKGGEIKPDRRLINDMIDALAAACHAEIPGEPAMLPGCDLDGAADDYLVLRNGVVHLPTRKLLPANPRLFTTRALPLVDFDPEAGAPQAFLSFLRELWPDDPEAIALLQEWLGLVALTSDTRHQKALLLIGPRRSGKGTLLRVLRELAGAANVCSPTFASLGSHFGLESLIGKRVAMITDARLSGRADVAAIAEAILRVTGEDFVTVPRKHRTDWTGRLPVRFIIATNELPALADASAALSSRFLILRMTRSFYGCEDHGLTDRLLAELPAILLWAMDGLDRLRARGRFVQPASGQELVGELENIASPITMFVRECCVVSPAARVETQALFSRWREWCHDAGRDHPGTAQNFGRQLRAALPEVTTPQARIGGRKVRVFQGIRLRSVTDPD